MAKKKHDIRELLSMLPEACVEFWFIESNTVFIGGFGKLSLDKYKHRFALACYCREVAHIIADEHGKRFSCKAECDGIWHQSYRAMNTLGNDFMEWAEQ